MPLPIPIPITLALQIDSRVMLFTTAIALAAGLVAGLAPSIHATRPNLVSDLKGETSMMATGRRRWTLRDGLVILQTAFTVVLLVTAGLLTRSIIEARRVNLGFAPAGLASVSAELGLVGYTEERARPVYERALANIRALPGVQSASRTVRQPLAINYNRNGVFLPGKQQPGDQPAIVAATWVDDAYFQTLGVPLLRGRNFTSGDTRIVCEVAIVTESFVRDVLERRPGPDRPPVPGPRVRRPRVRGRRRCRRLQGRDRRRKADAVRPLRTGPANVHRRSADGPHRWTTPDRSSRPSSASSSSSSRTRSSSRRRPWKARSTRRCCRRGWPRRREALVGLVATGSRRHRALRRDRVCRRPPHPRNRHPDGARRRAAAA